MTTKTYAIKLIKPVDDSWDFAGETLRNLEYIVKRFKNKAATDQYLSIVSKDKKSAAEINTGVKQGLAELAYLNYAQECFNGAIKEAVDKVSKDFKGIVTGKSSLITYKDGQPIPVRSRQITLENDNGTYYASIGLLSREYATELGREGRQKARIKFVLSSKGNEKVVLDRILSGEYKLCDSSIQRKGNAWYLQLAHSFEAKAKTDLIANRVLGIDIGISKAVYMAVSDSPVNAFIDGGEIEQFRNKTEHRRNQMRNQLKWCSDNRKSHGRNTLLKPLEVLESKVSDFRKLTNHRYAKYVVDFAVKNQCSIIQMEDLSGINTRSAFLKRWSYFDLQTKIEDKAAAHGIKVVKVNPKYTSQRCYNCGVIAKDNRESQSVYKCECTRRTKKGVVAYKVNADLNAARNLSVLGIDKEIKAQCKAQKIAY
ncbi:transposase [Macrococcus armenti]|uniref:RNA-guided endonuclease TnpB family protein n=1 Tax=Macrococcus armenti TaxID=2875764 RepID=UPI001CCEAD28|nr:RNA-guided endonuclease TnpB family protein [Macrococcus armenti]UBH21941.1 transposase [Macrococcus armenti]